MTAVENEMWRDPFSQTENLQQRKLKKCLLLDPKYEKKIFSIIVIIFCSLTMENDIRSWKENSL